MQRQNDSLLAQGHFKQSGPNFPIMASFLMPLGLRDPYQPHVSLQWDPRGWGHLWFQIAPRPSLTPASVSLGLYTFNFQSDKGKETPQSELNKNHGLRAWCPNLASKLSPGCNSGQVLQTPLPPRKDCLGRDILNSDIIHKKVYTGVLHTSSTGEGWVSLNTLFQWTQTISIK